MAQFAWSYMFPTSLHIDEWMFVYPRLSGVFIPQVSALVFVQSRQLSLASPDPSSDPQDGDSTAATTSLLAF
jgi:hypothetical protein